MKLSKHIIPLIIILSLLSGVPARLFGEPARHLFGEPAEPSAPLVPTLQRGNDTGGWWARLIKSENLSLTISQRTWLSTGKSDQNHADSDGSPNIISELKYNDLDSTVIEITADALLYKKFILTIDYGYGTISDGTLKDTDYAGDNRTLLWSQSVGAIDDDDMWYVNADIGYRVLSWHSPLVPTLQRGNEKEKKSSLDLLIGYQHWLETYVDKENVQTQDPYNLFGGTGPFDDQGRGITDEYTWDSLRVGARAAIELLPCLSIKTRLMFIPWTHYEERDIHHMRTTLKKNPSFETRADGGFGIMSDTTLSYNVWRGLSIEAGYQIWDISSGNGTLTSRAFTGDVDSRFNEANTTRQGAIVGINYRF